MQPGAVWELPERARAYLLDLLQGGGVKLHVEYVDLIYRTLHDLGESPRTRLRREPRRALRRRAEHRAGPAAEEGAAQAADPRRRLPPPQRDGPAHPRAATRRRRATRRTARASSGAAAAARPQPPRRGRDARSSPPASTRAAARPTSWASRTRSGVRALAGGAGACGRRVEPWMDAMLGAFSQGGEGRS